MARRRTRWRSAAFCAGRGAARSFDDCAHAALIDLETHRTVFTWVQQRLVEAGRLTGKTIAMTPRRSRRTRRCAASSAGTPARATRRFWRVSRRPRGSRLRAGLARLDRKRKKKTSNTAEPPRSRCGEDERWRTHLAHKAEHAVDMETGAIVAVTLHGADSATPRRSSRPPSPRPSRSKTRRPTDDRQSLDEIVGDKGYHSNQTLIDLAAVGIRSYVSEPDRGRRDWSKDPEARRRCMAIVAGCGDDAAAA